MFRQGHGDLSTFLFPDRPCIQTDNCSNNTNTCACVIIKLPMVRRSNMSEVVPDIWGLWKHARAYKEVGTQPIFQFLLTTPCPELIRISLHWRFMPKKKNIYHHHHHHACMHACMHALILDHVYFKLLTEKVPQLRNPSQNL
jgi:hypothetical protein